MATLLCLILSGCTSLEIPDHPEAPEYSPPMERAEPWVATGTNCYSNQLVLFVEFNATAHLIPLGFRAREASELFSAGAATGKAAALAIIVRCSWTATEDIRTMTTGIIVETPPGAPSEGPLDVYEIERFAQPGAFFDNLTAFGWPVKQADRLTIDNTGAGGPQTIVSDAFDGGSEILSFAGVTPGQDYSIPADETRIWRATDYGMAYVTTPVPTKAFAGAGECNLGTTRLKELTGGYTICPLAQAVLATLPPGPMTFAHDWGSLP